MLSLGYKITEPQGELGQAPVDYVRKAQVRMGQPVATAGVPDEPVAGTGCGVRRAESHAGSSEPAGDRGGVVCSVIRLLCPAVFAAYHLTALPGLGLPGYSWLPRRGSGDYVARLRALLPDAEIVCMLGGRLGEEELRELQNREGEGAKGRALPAIGRLRVGQELRGWRIESMVVRRESLGIGATTHRGDRLQVDVRMRDEARLAPFSVGDGGLYYRPTDAQFREFEPFCREVAMGLSQALGSCSLLEALSRWRREGE